MEIIARGQLHRRDADSKLVISYQFDLGNFTSAPGFRNQSQNCLQGSKHLPWKFSTADGAAPVQNWISYASPGNQPHAVG